ncbi:MAG TPA: AbrB/MazE/SpoVT family DNA-binding domain-containing protein [Candidatus Saccharimonadales bacterium]
MTTRNVTITSKNQITLPADLVRDMRLKTHRRLSIRKRGDELILIPEPELKDQLQKIWDQLPTFQGTTSDKQLKDTTNEAWVNKKP